MNGFGTIFQLTLAEARRRRILLAALVCALGFLVLYGTGFHFIHRDIAAHSVGNAVKARLALLAFVIAGLYAANFLMVMTAILMPVDTLAGEIASGVMQTLASKPIRRSTLVLGKWLAHSAVLVGYLLFTAGGVLLIARAIGGVTPPGVARGLALMALEGLVLVSLSIAGGTRLTTVTNGIVVLGLYGLALVASWTEQIGTMVGNTTASYVGTAASLIMPSESMWQLAAWHMQPALLRDLHMTPFGGGSVPSPLMVAWTAGYVVVVLVCAMRGLETRAL